MLTRGDNPQTPPQGQAADIGGVRDILLRVSRLADDLPQVAELDLNPVIARPEGVIAVDACVRVTSHTSPTRSCASFPQAAARPEDGHLPEGRRVVMWVQWSYAASALRWLA